jgi:hypothetical protein
MGEREREFITFISTLSVRDLLPEKLIVIVGCPNKTT